MNERGHLGYQGKVGIILKCILRENEGRCRLNSTGYR